MKISNLILIINIIFLNHNLCIIVIIIEFTILIRFIILEISWLKILFLKATHNILIIHKWLSPLRSILNAWIIINKISSKNKFFELWFWNSFYIKLTFKLFFIHTLWQIARYRIKWNFFRYKKSLIFNFIMEINSSSSWCLSDLKLSSWNCDFYNL